MAAWRTLLDPDPIKERKRASQASSSEDDDEDREIALLREVLELQPASHLGRSLALNNLAHCLFAGDRSIGYARRGGLA